MVLWEVGDIEMALIPHQFVGVPPSMYLETLKTLVYNPAFQVVLLAFGLLVAGLFGLIELVMLVRGRSR